jgi:hypothetical protein
MQSAAGSAEHIAGKAKQGRLQSLIGLIHDVQGAEFLTGHPVFIARISRIRLKLI